jgi:hypothetical protein
MSASQMLASLEDLGSDVPLPPRERMRWSMTLVERAKQLGVRSAVIAVLVWLGAGSR